MVYCVKPFFPSLLLIQPITYLKYVKHAIAFLFFVVSNNIDQTDIIVTKSIFRIKFCIFN